MFECAERKEQDESPKAARFDLLAQAITKVLQEQCDGEIDHPRPGLKFSFYRVRPKQLTKIKA
ncbi:hypothetical protein SAMN05216525_103323 [Bradyrhizobium sp. Gha]|nr:hypothetical protein SAMN05216525_103323 [Bradyrhizobium sp. Gha]